MLDKLLSYGMGPEKLWQKLNANGYKISFEDSKALFYKYKDRFKVAMKYLDSHKKKARADLEITNLVGRKRRWREPNFHKMYAILKEEFVKSGREFDIQAETRTRELAHGKIRGQWAAIEREAANFDIQSTNVEFTKESMYLIRKRCKDRNYDARFYNSVYDETVLDIASKDAEEVHELQKKTMIECGEKYCTRVPIEVEGHLVPYWTK